MDGEISTSVRWTERLAFDIALRLENSGESVEDILSRHGMTGNDLLKISKDPIFAKKVESYRTEIRDKGLTFRLKARAQAEELLKTSWVLIHSPEVSAAVKADLIKSTVKWAGLEPKQEMVTPEGGANGVRITINLGGSELETKLVDTTPVDTDTVEYDDDYAD
jgi:hypothetical protein